MPELTISEEDVASLQAKLDAWAATLTESERAIVQMMLVRAFPESVPHYDEVSGFAASVGGGGGGTFEVEDYSFDIEQVLNIGSQSSGAGAGKVTFNPFSIGRGAVGSPASQFVGLRIHKP